MQEEIGEHDDHAVPPVVRSRMAKDALPDLRIPNVVADRHRSRANLARMIFLTSLPGPPGNDFRSHAVFDQAPDSIALTVRSRDRDETRRIRPLPKFFLEFPTLVDFDRAVFRDANRHSLQRPRGRPL